jgi:hypothetical protein
MQRKRREASNEQQMAGFRRDWGGAGGAEIKNDAEAEGPKQIGLACA